MGITLHQARILAYLAEKNGCITQVSFQRRAMPLAVLLREQVLKHGPVIHACCTYVKYVPGADVRATGQMIQNGVHVIDTLRWMCGGEVAEVQSMTRCVNAPDINFMTATIRFDNGAVGIMTSSYSTGRHVFSLEMHGVGISALANAEGWGTYSGKECRGDECGHLYPHDQPQGIAYDARQVAGSDEFYIWGGFQAKHRDFIDCVKSGQQPESHFGDAVKTMEVADAILAQAHLAEL
jgi:virulence factor